MAGRERTLGSDWSDEEMAIATRRWAEGWSAGQISREIPRSRNAILGMANRNRDKFPERGMRGRGYVDRRPAEAKPKRMSRPARPRPAAAEVVRYDIPAPAAPEVMSAHDRRKLDPMAAPGLAPVALWERRDTQCAFPLWDSYGDKPTAESLYCGAAIDAADRYCAHHRLMMYQPRVEAPKQPTRQANANQRRRAA